MQQAEVDELVQSIPGDLHRHVASGRGEGRIVVVARYHGQPPEYPPGGVCELLVRHPERGCDLQITGLELIQPVLLVRQPGRQFGGIPAWAADQPVPCDPQRQRHALAQSGKLVECRFLIAGGTLAQNPRQQFLGLRQRKGSEGEPAYTFQASQRPLRAVISARLSPSPGSSGRTCSSDPALSSTTRRLPVPQQRPVHRSTSNINLMSGAATVRSLLEVTYAAPLGPLPLLLRALERRLPAAAFEDRAEVGVVLAAAGSSDSRGERHHRGDRGPVAG